MILQDSCSSTFFLLFPSPLLVVTELCLDSDRGLNQKNSVLHKGLRSFQKEHLFSLSSMFSICCCCFLLDLGFSSTQELLFSTSYCFVKSGTFRVLNNTTLTKEVTLKPSISTHSKPSTMPCTRLLKCFVFITLCCKTKYLRSLVQAMVGGFE